MLVNLFLDAQRQPSKDPTKKQKNEEVATRCTTCSSSKNQQVGTSSQDAANTNTLQVPQYRVIGSSIIDPFDLGKKNHRQDRGSCIKRMYYFQRWKPRTTKSRKHISHFTVADPKQIPQSQQIPGHCLLCPQQFFTNQKFQMHAHYERLH